MNTDQERFYFYFLCDPRKPGSHNYGQYSLPFEPYYCGKGVRTRVLSKKNKKAQDKTNKIRSLGLEPYHINIGPFDEDTAFNYEEMFVSLIGRDDLQTGPLFNLQDGGKGGKSPSLESRQKMSDSHIDRTYEELFGKDKSDKMKDDLSLRWKDNNPTKKGNIPWNIGKNYSTYIGASVIVDGVYYPTKREASKQTGASIYLLNKGRTVKLNPISASKPIVINNVEYTSHSEACELLNITRKQIKNIINGKPTKLHSFKVIIDDIEYKSIAKAMQSTGMSRIMITKNYLVGDKDEVIKRT